MKSILDLYLDRVLVYANLDDSRAESTRKELKDHLLQKVDDLRARGTATEEATLEALRQHGSPRKIGYALRGPFPWIDVRSQGTARGVVAIGPRAVGIFAFGGIAVGVFAMGGISVGIFGAGGIVAALLFAWGGIGIGAVASAGVAIGLAAFGGMATGLVAKGGFACGAWVPNAGQAVCYFSATTVPPWLRSLEPLLNVGQAMERYAYIVWPIYIVLLVFMITMQLREAKRVASSDNDWLIDG